MRLRPYRNSDFTYLEKWVSDPRIHALWSANVMPYPLTEPGFLAVMEKNAQEWGDCGYTFTEDDGTPVGFFALSVNEKENAGFAKFIVVDNGQRGKGYGTRMIRKMLQYAFGIVELDTVRLNVYDVNEGAKRCYEKAGFMADTYTPDVMVFEGENWGRYLMVAKK